MRGVIIPIAPVLDALNAHCNPRHNTRLMSAAGVDALVPGSLVLGSAGPDVTFNGLHGLYQS